MLTIKNDRLYRGDVPVAFVRSPNQGGRISPSLIVLHDTAGRLTPGNSVSWFKNPKSRVSAHFVVEIDGSITQMVDCDCTAWHAGKSSWKGRSGCNAFAVGIEIVNPGKLTPAGTAWFGQTFQGVQEATTSAHGKGCWLPYTPAQIEAVKAICGALVEAYPIKEIVTHWMISPGRKVDCNPLLPLDEIRREVLARPGSVGEWPLQLGSEGENVKLAQKRLAELGYGHVGNPDGIFGPQTRAAVLAWEAENGAATEGKLDRAEFDALMAPEAKPMVVGPATAKAQAEQKQAAQVIEAAAKVTTVATGAATVTDAALVYTDNTSLWDMTMQGLSQAGEVVTKINMVGVQMEPRYALAGLGLVGCIVLWRYAKRLGGSK